MEMADLLFSFCRLSGGPEEGCLFLSPLHASVDFGLPGCLTGLLVYGGIAWVGVARLAGGCVGWQSLVELRGGLGRRGEANNAA